MNPTRRECESGVAMLALVVIMLPLLFLLGSYLQTMAGRQGRLQTEILEEQALLDAESGIDVAVYEARRGTLVAGHMAQKTFSGAVPGGGFYEVTCTYLGDDDDDNDRDGQEDEPDEDVYRVVSLGTHGRAKRCVAVHLGFADFLPMPAALITMLNPSPTDVRMQGSATLDGRNYSLAGTLVGSDNTPGISMTAPEPTSKITSLLTATEGSKVLGNTPAPSVGSQSVYNAALFNQILTQARNAAQIVLTSPSISGGQWGNATTGPQYSIYRRGDLRISGNTTGAGLLVVDGNLSITGGMTWHGIVLVTGDFECGSGNSAIYGAMIIGPGGRRVEMGGTADLMYSRDAARLATNLTGRYSAFNGWQEISTNE